MREELTAAYIEKKEIEVIELDKKTLSKNVSIALYQVRWGLSLRQPFVADETGITQQQLSAYEKGETLPSILSLVKLADLYDISLDYLVGRCQNSKAHKTTKTFTYKEESNHANR
ncbi:MAG: helix-turn-helix transcriptional regulator [Petrimonas sp.]|jgi:DNA-binding XRE family transcriptional regulator|nr:helix-turn-helix transcriptional regulator [Petrimonas sp.]